MLIQHVFLCKYGMLVLRILPSIKDPFHSVLGAVKPVTGVTLTLARRRETFQLRGLVSDS
jgi:hypothetical protein